MPKSTCYDSSESPFPAVIFFDPTGKNAQSNPAIATIFHAWQLHSINSTCQRKYPCERTSTKLVPGQKNILRPPKFTLLKKNGKVPEGNYCTK
jgi:hypothetical protein